MNEEEKESKIGKKIVFEHAGSEVEAIVFEENVETFGNIKYLYKARDKYGYKYSIQKINIISLE